MELPNTIKRKYIKAKIGKSIAMSNNIESQIIKLAQDIYQSKLNIFKDPNYTNTLDVMRFIQYILVKRFRSKEDREVLIEYLKSLEKFMSLICDNCSVDFLNEMLSRVSKSLQLQEFPQNNILFRIGQKGSLFFILIKGSVSVLIPKIVKIQMTPDEYLEHLCFLNQMEEFELLEKTSEENKEIFNVNISDPSTPKIINMVNKSLESYSQREVIQHSVDDYINCLMPKVEKEHNNYYPYLNVFIYHKVTHLIEGNSFGETALLSKNQKRTATIYVNEDTFFGVLNELDFNMSLKTIQLQTKRDRVLFVMSFALFNNFSFEYFVKKYWNNFTYIQLKQNDNLFQQNDKRDLIYFMKDGEIDLTAKLSMVEISKLLKKLGDKSAVENTKMTINRPKKYKIANIRNASIIGLDDLIDDKEDYFCSATCSSKKANLLAIDYIILKEIIEDVKKQKQFEGITSEKVELMVDRLKTFQQVDNFILEKEPYSVIREKVLPAFSKKEPIIKMIRPITPSSNSKDIFGTIRGNTDRRPTLRKENLEILLEKIKQEKRFTVQYEAASPLKRKENKGRTFQTKGRGSLFSSRLRPHPILYFNCSDSFLNRDKSSFWVPRESAKKNLINYNSNINNDIVYEKTQPSTGIMTEKRKSKAKPTRESTFDSDDKQLEGQTKAKAKAIANKMSSKTRQTRMVYSHLILNPDFTLTTTYNIGNIMDYCLMEENKGRLTYYRTQILKKPKIRSQSMKKKKLKLKL